MFDNLGDSIKDALLQWHLLWATTSYDPYQLCRFQSLTSIRCAVISDIGSAIFLFLIPILLTIFYLWAWRRLKKNNQTWRSNRMAYVFLLQVMALSAFLQASFNVRVLDILIRFTPFFSPTCSLGVTRTLIAGVYVIWLIIWRKEFKSIWQKVVRDELPLNAMALEAKILREINLGKDTITLSDLSQWLADQNERSRKNP